MKNKIVVFIFCLFINFTLQVVSKPIPDTLQAKLCRLLKRLDAAEQLDDTLKNEVQDLIERLTPFGAFNEIQRIQKRLPQFFPQEQLSLENDDKIKSDIESQAENKQYAEQIKNIITTYKLVLPNKQSLEFDKPLIEQSILLKETMTGEFMQGDTEYPVTQYITTLQAKNPDEVSLQDLHNILQVIAQNKNNPQPALRKLLRLDDSLWSIRKLWSQQPSFERMVQLFRIAQYFDIRPLQQVTATFIVNLFAQNSNNKQYRAIIATLSNDWQKELTYLAMIQNDVLSNFLTRYNKPIRTLQGNAGPINSVTWSPDNTKIASGSRDFIQIWDIETGQKIQTLHGHTGSINSVAWSRDNTKLASGSSHGTIKIWNPVTGQLIDTIFGPDLVNSVAWSPDSTKLASGHKHPAIHIWDAVTGNLIQALQGGQEWPVNSVAWSLDNTKLASGSFNSKNVHGIIDIWDVATWRKEKQLTDNSTVGSVFSIAWSPDSTKLASSYWDAVINIWDIATGIIVQKLRGDAWNAKSVAWSSDNTKLASGSSTGAIKIRDTARWEELQIFQDHPSSVNSVAWSPDNTKLASGSDDTTIKIWDVESISHLFKLTIPQLIFLEKVIKAKKIVISMEEVFIFWGLPKKWQTMLFTAYGNPKITRN